jgi:molybdopterin molybdotransferase
VKSVEEAAHEILASFRPIGEERLPLLSALGRFLSGDVFARFDSPLFDNSAMDGYAVRADELASASDGAPLALFVRGESRAGGAPPEPLAPHSAMRIFTGAPLPALADAVVLQEDTQRDGERVQLREAPRPGDNVRARASDLRRGELALTSHSRIGPGEVALLASQEYASVTVFRRPRVAILATGDELRDIGEPARPGSIVNSNAYALAAQVLEAGADPWLLPPVGDRLEEVRDAVRAGLVADVLVMSGGVSVGEYDVVRDALAAEGVALDFWKVRMKPGKPLAFGRHGAVPLLGLPGNPVSAFVTFELFVRPGLRKMLGSLTPARPRVRVRLAEPWRRKAGRTEFARARLEPSDHGLVARLAARQGSGAVTALANVQALVVIPAECEALEAGAPLEALLLSSFPGADSDS